MVNSKRLMQFLTVLQLKKESTSEAVIVEHNVLSTKLVIIKLHLDNVNITFAEIKRGKLCK